ncbi:MAG: hypothetical protein ACI81R_003701, partial [Bradymonadia bacterium]
MKRRDSHEDLERYVPLDPLTSSRIRTRSETSAPRPRA